jgi:hypothetical protein
VSAPAYQDVDEAHHVKPHVVDGLVAASYSSLAKNHPNG